jgi:Sulfotransferase family
VDYTFLVCSERSGSNLIRNMMGSHSAICAPPPAHLFRLFLSNESNYGDLKRDANWDTLLNDIVTAFDNQLGIWNTRLGVDDLQRHVLQRSAAAAIGSIYEEEANQEGATHLFIKENHTARFASILRQAFNPCRFVFLVRDPRDVAVSFLTTDSMPGGVAKAVDIWRADQMDNCSLQSTFSESNICHFLKYENLIKQPEIELRNLTDFVGLDFEPQILNFHLNESVRRNAARIEAWSNLSKPVMKDNAGKFESTLTRDEIEYVELCCFDLMKILGFELTVIDKLPAEPELSQKIIRLADIVREGRSRVVNEEEKIIRERRQAVIDTVLSRHLT